MAVLANETTRGTTCSQGTFQSGQTITSITVAGFHSYTYPV
jgi:hypothetical protein